MLRRRIQEIAREAGAESFAVAYHDYETETAWSVHGSRPFHAASTIKVAVLFGLFAAIDNGRFALDDRLHVRNRFSSAVDGEPFRVASGRDANADVHAARGKSMRVGALARHMITTSSNLATNLLLDLVGVEAIRERLRTLGIEGVSLRRGVEDERAFAEDVNNEATADGLVALFRAIHEARGVSEESAGAMREILFEQQFRSGIPAGLPEAVRDRAQIGNKTGEISTVAHDAALVLLPDRAPYVLAVLTAWRPDASGRRETLAKISRTVYDHLAAKEEADG